MILAESDRNNPGFSGANRRGHNSNVTVSPKSGEEGVWEIDGIGWALPKAPRSYQGPGWRKRVQPREKNIFAEPKPLTAINDCD